MINTELLLSSIPILVTLSLAFLAGLSFGRNIERKYHQGLIRAMADRIEKQSELLSKAAGRKQSS